MLFIPSLSSPCLSCCPAHRYQYFRPWDKFPLENNARREGDRRRWSSEHIQEQNLQTASDGLPLGSTYVGQTNIHHVEASWLLSNSVFQPFTFPQRWSSPITNQVEPPIKGMGSYFTEAE